MVRLVERRLTATEARLANLIASGWSDSRIARQLGLDPRTIEQHLADVYRKLDVGSRTELALLFGPHDKEESK